MTPKIIYPSYTRKHHHAKQMSSSFMLFTIIIFTINQICISESADISDIRRLRIRAALSDPIEESCKGSLDYNGFSKLDKICKDCFNLIREPEIYQLCRSGCFGTGYFYGCMDSILLQSEMKSEISMLLDEMHGHASAKRK